MPIKEQLILEGKDQTRGAFNSVQRSLKTLESGTTRLNRGLGGLTRSLGGVAVALGGAFTVKGIIDVTARFEDLRTTLASVTGSAEAGAEAFDFITKFSTQTQFGVEELTQTYIKLASNGIDPSVELLTKFTDAAAVTTDQIGSLQSLTDFYTRSLQAQTVELTDLNRLSDRGLPVYDIIKEKLGITRSEISKFSKEIGGTVKIVEALGEGITERFGGATQARVQNLSTRISNFQIALTQAADTLGQGLNKALGETIVSMTELITENDELIRQIGVDLGEGIKKAAEFAKDLKEPVQDIGDALATMIKGFDTLPDYAKSVGIVGAVLFGKKGAAALAGISYVFGKIKQEVEEFNDTLDVAQRAAEGDLQSRLQLIDKEIAHQKAELMKELTGADFTIDLKTAFDPTIPDFEFVPLEILPDYEARQKVIQDLERERAQIVSQLNVETEEQNAIMRMALQDAADYEARQKSLNQALSDNSDQVEKATTNYEKLLEPYKEFITMGEKYFEQSDQPPLIQNYLKAGQAVQELQKAMDKIDFDDTEKGVESFLKLNRAIQGATKAQETFLEEIKRSIDDPYKTQLQLLDEALQDELYMIEFYHKNERALAEDNREKLLQLDLAYDIRVERARAKHAKAKADIEKQNAAEILRIKEEALREELKLRGVNDEDINKRLELEKASRFEQGREILGNTVKIFEALGQENEKAFRAYKAFAIAQAIIDAIASAQSAFRALVGIPVVGPVLAVTAAGAALAAGYARVNQIRSQQYQGRREGGAVTGGTSYLVGEDQPEIFTPKTNGDITPLDKLDGGREPVQVIFQIQANDTRGFDDLIKQRRGLIVNMINDAVMNKGKEALI